MILIGIDDTDMPDTPGTNQLARAIVRALAGEWRLEWIVRHQLLDDPRVPYTSKNGSASILLQPRGTASTQQDSPQHSSAGQPDVIDTCRRVMREWYVAGSDPGLCVAEWGRVSPAVTAFGRACQGAVQLQTTARELAAREGLWLEGLGGTEGGVIGALAAVGLAREAEDGRIVQWQEWPDDLSGLQPVETIRSRNLTVVEAGTNLTVESGEVDVGKHLRPNLRQGRGVLYTRRSVDTANQFEALKLT